MLSLLRCPPFTLRSYFLTLASPPQFQEANTQVHFQYRNGILLPRVDIGFSRDSMLSCFLPTHTVLAMFNPTPNIAKHNPGYLGGVGTRGRGGSWGTHGSSSVYPQF